MTRKKLITLFAVFVVVFAVGVIAVTYLRVPIYYNELINNTSSDTDADAFETSTEKDIDFTHAVNDSSIQVSTRSLLINNEAVAIETNTTPVVIHTQQDKQESTEITNLSASMPVQQTEVPEGMYDYVIREILLLTVDRWIGLEGVMSLVNANTNFSLFYQGIKEDPVRGVNAIYQKISNSQYVESDSFTFLTIPGILAILYYSGSALFVAIAMLLITLCLIFLERLISRYLQNPMLVSLTGLFAANVICQMNFPYLAIVFFIELLGSLFLIYLLQNSSHLVARFRQPMERT